jgi:hypothetical protein
MQGKCRPARAARRNADLPGHRGASDGQSRKERRMSKTNPLGFRIERDLKDALVRAARDDRRSVSSMVQIILERWLIEKGYLAQEHDEAA